jgi:putative FmdB family regulatory protein
MPFYEYRCHDCGQVFPLLQKRDAARSGYACPSCEGARTERVFSVFASAVAGKSAAETGCAMAGGPAACSHAGSCGCGHRH